MDGMTAPNSPDYREHDCEKASYARISKMATTLEEAT